MSNGVCEIRFLDFPYEKKNATMEKVHWVLLCHLRKEEELRNISALVL